MFYRDYRALFFTLFFPLLFMAIFGIADFGKFANSKIGIIDDNKSEQSQQIIDAMKNISILEVHQDINDILKNQLKNGDIDLIVEIPKDLVKINMVDTNIPGVTLPPTIKLPKKPEYQLTEITVYTNESRAQQAQSALVIIKEVFNKMTYQIEGMQEIFSFKEESVSNKSLTYLDFLIPGIIALSIMQMSVMQILFTIVGYREKGILKRLQITPMSPVDFTASQVITRIIISLIQISILIAIALLFFKLNIIGNYWLIALLVLLGSAIFISMGMALSGIAKTQNTAAPLANIILLPMMFLGNVFFPVSTMPDWLQKVVNYLPLNYLADAMRKVMVDGATITKISHDMYGLVVWAILMIIVASLTFRWKTID